uniref:Cyclin-like domain-containing protein n=1 Tax=Ficedula albicollis TaxID=59894 RepID=A0A803VRU6_FICAL
PPPPPPPPPPPGRDPAAAAAGGAGRAGAGTPRGSAGFFFVLARLRARGSFRAFPGRCQRLPVAMATGQVLFQRFFYTKSFVKHSMEHVSMACVHLASKIEEAPRRIRDVINVFHRLRHLREKKKPVPLILDQEYVNLKNQIIKAERRVLKELGFCVHVKHPHKIIVMYLQVLECERNQHLVQTSWVASEGK